MFTAVVQTIPDSPRMAQPMRAGMAVTGSYTNLKFQRADFLPQGLGEPFINPGSISPGVDQDTSQCGVMTMQHCGAFTFISTRIHTQLGAAQLRKGSQYPGQHLGECIGSKFSYTKAKIRWEKR